MARVPAGSQGAYSYAQLEDLWVQAGGPPRLAPLMAAIAMAESSGDPGARNPSGASGLWQILGQPFPGNVFDPYTNAQMAVWKWKVQGLRAWETYTSGAYKRFLQKGAYVPPPAQRVYQNPFRSVRGLSAERVDMGVDYAGQAGSPVYALGPGVITESGFGWRGAVGAPYPGAFITERLTQGPLSGHYVYLAEDVIPQVRKGQRVGPSTVIGTITGAGQLETGIAYGPGQPSTTAAMAAGQSAAGGDPGARPTAYGAAYSRILQATGAPAGVLPAGAGQVVGGQIKGTSGTLPGWLGWVGAGIQDLIGGPGTFAVPSLDPLSGIGQALSNIGQSIGTITTAIDWLLIPSNWVRIWAGLSGGVLVITGLVAMGFIGQARPVALPLSIGLVGTGAVLLFVAFHNLGVSNFPELLGYFRDTAQAQSGTGSALGSAV